MNSTADDNCFYVRVVNGVSSQDISSWYPVIRQSITHIFCELDQHLFNFVTSLQSIYSTEEHSARVACETDFDQGRVDRGTIAVNMVFSMDFSP
jgi:hypothetical protein